MYLCIYVSVCLSYVSINLCIFVSACLCVYVSRHLSLSLSLSRHLSVYLSINLPSRLSIYPSICISPIFALSICLPIYVTSLSLYLSIYLSVYLSIYLPIYLYCLYRLSNPSQPLIFCHPIYLYLVFLLCIRVLIKKSTDIFMHISVVRIYVLIYAGIFVCLCMYRGGALQCKQKKKWQHNVT